MVRHLRGPAPVTPLRLRHAIPGDEAALLTLTRIVLWRCAGRTLISGTRFIRVWRTSPQTSRLERSMCSARVMTLWPASPWNHHFDPLWDGLDWSSAGEPPIAVHRLMVDPSQQGRGLAKALMLHAEDVARAKGCRSIRLDTFLHNPAAMALYPRLGYRRTGTAMMRKGEFVGFENCYVPPSIRQHHRARHEIPPRA